MPLKSTNVPETIMLNATRKIKTLCRSGLIRLPEEDEFKPGFCMPIQEVPKKQIADMRFGKPEGLRVFVQAGKRVAAAVDFHYKGKRLQLSHIYQGSGLKELLDVLNKLEKRYVKSTKAHEPELISFLPAPGVFILVRSGNQQDFYTSAMGQLRAITPEGLQRKVDRIISGQQSTQSINT